MAERKPAARRGDEDGIVRSERSSELRARAALGSAFVAAVGVGGWLALQPPGQPPAPAPSSEAAERARSEPGRAADPSAASQAAGANDRRVAPPAAARPVDSAAAGDPLARAMQRAIAEHERAAPTGDGAGAGPGAQQEVYVDQLGPGDGTGIHAFPKPGTKPLKSGLVVPDGFELPPGYVRHYQTTDDGRQLPPILMFHPDHRPLGPDGQPLPLPADRVVPPELAPEGMPQQMLQAPAVRKDLDRP